METATKSNILTLKKPGRFGHGKWMTVAYLERPEWMAETPQGLLDLATTERILDASEKLLDLAAETASVVPESGGKLAAAGDCSWKAG